MKLRLVKITYMLICFILIFSLYSCGQKSDLNVDKPKETATANDPTNGQEEGVIKLMTEKINITMKVKNFGTIKAELYPDIAPISVANFVKLIEDGFYTDVIFHRIIPGFMIQGGGYSVEGEMKETDNTIKGEFSANGIKNTLKHTRGVLSMARTNIKDSASSQIFIMHQDSPHLDGSYAAFGCVIEGMDVVDAIAAVKTDASDVPVEFVVIESVTVDK